MIKEKNTIGQYVCAICGKPYSTVQERAKCEMTCVKRIEAEEKKAAEAKKKAEQDVRSAEVTKAIENAYTLLTKYIKDYGPYQYNGDIKEFDMNILDYFPSKLWHHFWL